jgi:hypothetical protein
VLLDVKSIRKKARTSLEAHIESLIDALCVHNTQKIGVVMTKCCPLMSSIWLTIFVV